MRLLSSAHLEEQDTQPLPILRLQQHPQELPAARFRRLKAISDRTGVRLLFVYLSDEYRRQHLGWLNGETIR